jgi:predicted esterase
MIEHIPEHVKTALLYFHSAGTTSDEFAPFLAQFTEQLPTTYLWAGDGVISGSPLMRHGGHYGNAPKRYWFTFPMQDASTQESFAANTEAMGAALMCGGAYVNALVDQVMARFKLTAGKIVLCGFQHGGCLALSTSMMRIHDPFAFTILLEPYLLEAYYLKDEDTLPNTTVVCIENQHIRERTRNWLHVETEQELQSYGIATKQITVADGGDAVDAPMMNEVINIVQNL